MIDLVQQHLMPMVMLILMLDKVEIHLLDKVAILLVDLEALHKEIHFQVWGLTLKIYLEKHLLVVEDHLVEEVVEELM